MLSLNLNKVLENFFTLVTTTKNLIIFGAFFSFQYRKSIQREDTKVERVDFILSEPKAIINAVLDNSSLDWLSLREGDGVVSHYQIIIISSLTIEATRTCVRVCTGLTFCDVAPRQFLLVLTVLVDFQICCWQY